MPEPLLNPSEYPDSEQSYALAQIAFALDGYEDCTDTSEQEQAYDMFREAIADLSLMPEFNGFIWNDTQDAPDVLSSGMYIQDYSDTSSLCVGLSYLAPQESIPTRPTIAEALILVTEPNPLESLEVKYALSLTEKKLVAERRLDAGLRHAASDELLARGREHGPVEKIFSEGWLDVIAEEKRLIEEGLDPDLDADAVRLREEEPLYKLWSDHHREVVASDMLHDQFGGRKRVVGVQETQALIAFLRGLQSTDNEAIR